MAIELRQTHGLSDEAIARRLWRAYEIVLSCADETGTATPDCLDSVPGAAAGDARDREAESDGGRIAHHD